MAPHLSFQSLREKQKPIEDAPLYRLPSNESNPLSVLHERFNAEIISRPEAILHPSDPWRSLSTNPSRALCLRFLRYHHLNVEKSIRHLLEVAKWRGNNLPWNIEASVLHDRSSGMPFMNLEGKGSDGEIILYGLVRQYNRDATDYGMQENAVKYIFEWLMYLQNGHQALSSIVIWDFDGIKLKHIDLHAAKTCIQISADYYPEFFKKIIILNYPRWMHGIWNIVKTFLDARTIGKVIWISSKEELVTELQKYFEVQQIPEWLGGKGPQGSLTLYNQGILDPKRIFKDMR